MLKRDKQSCIIQMSTNILLPKSSSGQDYSSDGTSGRSQVTTTSYITSTTWTPQSPQSVASASRRMRNSIISPTHARPSIGTVNKYGHKTLKQNHGRFNRSSTSPTFPGSMTLLSVPSISPTHNVSTKSHLNYLTTTQMTQMIWTSPLKATFPSWKHPHLLHRSSNRANTPTKTSTSTNSSTTTLYGMPSGQL